jgi:hypothetical protein
VRARRQALGVAALAAGALAAGVLVWGARVGAPERGAAGPRGGAARGAEGRATVIEAAPDGAPRKERPAAGAPDPVPVDQALAEHAAVAAPAWRAAADILAHSPHPELQDLAVGFATRLDAAARGLDAPTRQELVNEERQLLHFLKTRYAGLEPLERALAPAERSLDRLQAAQAADGVGPSPRPPGAP